MGRGHSALTRDRGDSMSRKSEQQAARLLVQIANQRRWMSHLPFNQPQAHAYCSAAHPKLGQGCTCFEDAGHTGKHRGYSEATSTQYTWANRTSIQSTGEIN